MDNRQPVLDDRERRFAVSLVFLGQTFSLPNKVVELRSTPRQLFKKSWTKNFYAASRCDLFQSVLDGRERRFAVSLVF